MSEEQTNKEFMDLLDQPIENYSKSKKDLSEKNPSPKTFTADEKFDKKEAQKVADAFKSRDPKKFGQIIKEINNNKEFNQTADVKFDKEEAQKIADAFKSKDPKKFGQLNNKEKEQVDDLVYRPDPKKQSPLNKLLSNSGKQLDMETLNNAIEESKNIYTVQSKEM